jgi:RP/EB family microtubule-associated protein
MKCKLQDNLEFMQWVKRYWDQNYPGGDYTPSVRRKPTAGATSNGRTSSASRASATPAKRATKTPGKNQDGNRWIEHFIDDFYFSIY